MGAMESLNYLPTIEKTKHPESFWDDFLSLIPTAYGDAAIKLTVNLHSDRCIVFGLRSEKRMIPGYVITALKLHAYYTA